MTIAEKYTINDGYIEEVTLQRSTENRYKIKLSHFSRNI